MSIVPLPEDNDIYAEFPRIFHNVLSEILAKRMLEILPDFRIDDSNDRFVLTTCKQDLVNYGIYQMKYSINNSEYIIASDLLRRGLDAVAELDTWINLWLTKYRQRTKVVSDAEFKQRAYIPNNNVPMINLQEDGIVPNPAKFHLDLVTYGILISIAIETLEQNNEIACTSILAKTVVDRVVLEEGQKSGFPEIIDEALKTTLISSIQRKIKDFSGMTRELILLKVK